MTDGGTLEERKAFDGDRDIGGNGHFLIGEDDSSEIAALILARLD